MKTAAAPILKLSVRVLVVLLLCAFLLPGCATTNKRRYKSELRRVLDQGVVLLGEKKIRVERKPFRSDCSGFVSACFWKIGRELTLPTAQGSSGTELIYNSLKEQGLIHKRRRPNPGDLAFFHHTHDRNGNGRRDDRFTHIALVERVDPDGTVHLIHFVSGKVRRDRMNLLHKNVIRDPKSGKEWNSHLRRGGGKTLSAQLLFRFGSPLGKGGAR